MLFVHVLLFSLLGTSVISLPVTPNDSPAIQVPHSPHFSLVQEPEDTATFSTLQKGKESHEPISVPDSLGHYFNRLPGPLPHQTLSLSNIELYAGLWYREPTTDVGYDRHNDIMHILLPADKSGMGIIVFHTMGELPWQVIWEYTLLTSENRDHLIGTWRRMPSALPKSHRNDVMMVWKTLGRLHYAVRSDRLGMRALDRINPIAVTHNALCRYCEGTWIRAPEEDTPEQYVNDVALIRLPRLIDMFIMNPIFGGPNTQIQSFHAERFAGTWYRAPGAFIEIGHRLDVMVVRMKDGQLTFYFFRQIVKMRGEPDEDVKARERIGH